MLEIYQKELASKKFKTLSSKEEFELGLEILKGSSSAKNKLIESNLRYAFLVASKYKSKQVPFEDIVSAANSGLIKAADKFDVSKGMRFTTYARHWIKAYIINSINEIHVVKTPEDKDNVECVSIDQSVDPSDNLYLYETIPYDGALANTEFEKADFKSHLLTLLSNYSQKQRDAIDSYFQIYNEYATPEGFQIKYEVSHEGLRKIKNRVLNELKLELEF